MGASFSVAAVVVGPADTAVSVAWAGCSACKARSLLYFTRRVSSLSTLQACLKLLILNRVISIESRNSFFCFRLIRGLSLIRS